MSVAAGPLLNFDNSYVRELEGLYQPWQAAQAPAPQLLALNTDLAAQLGVDAEALAAPSGVAVLVGNAVAPGSTPVAQAYAGHQFGGYSPRLGDGRALLLGEVLDVSGHRRDIHLKGSGRTPFARGGDGKAVVGPMLREYVIGEAMHALGVPSTRALAVVATGEQVSRGPMLPGAVLARVAASHLRVGTFEYAARLDPELLKRLADYAIARHHPEATDADNPYLALVERVVDVQASLIAQWMAVGFVHGVMNTDNMTISGETIDYGPCAFIDAFDPAAVFSSIDHAGRYAYGNQPHIAPWNLARFAETLLPLIDADTRAAAEAATAVLQSFPTRFGAAWSTLMRAKLGVTEEAPADLIDDLLALLHEHDVDYTTFFRSLSRIALGAPVPVALAAWSERWATFLPTDRQATADAMNRVNPVYIPRNHLVEDALTEATVGNLDPLHRLVDAITQPFEERPGLEPYADPPPAGFGDYVTYCGT